MKAKLTIIIAMTFAIGLVSCDNLSFKKTKSGLVYKIIPSSSKDSMIKEGNVVKFQFIRKLNDSLIYSSYGKMPGFAQVNTTPETSYSPLEIFPMLKTGDSAVTVESYDTLLIKGQTGQLPPNAKKGDKLTTYIKILEIYRTDSVAMTAYNAEMEKDKPRREKEMAEMQVKAEADNKIAMQKNWEEMKSSGEMENGIKQMESFLAGKKIIAQKTENGTFVVVNQKGSGQHVVDGKFVNVKYTGKILETDSVFQSNSYKFKLGIGAVIRGWDDGLKLFNVGGKGTLYIPGYLAYGKDPGPGNKPFQALVFDVEILEVTDEQ